MEPRVEAQDTQPATVYVRSRNLAAGPHSLEEIERALARCAVFVTDRAWHKGLHDWVPLSAILGGSVGNASPMPATEDGVDQFYNRVADSFRRATSELMESFFNLLSPLENDSNPTEWDHALLSCLKHVKTFHAQCTEMLATTVRYLTPSDVVKRTPIQQLSDEIRVEGFADAHKIAWVWGIETVASETKSRERWFHEYLMALNRVPCPLVECVSAKCYGANANTEKQKGCISSCAAQCDNITTKTLDLLAHHPSRQEVNQHEECGNRGVLLFWIVVILFVLAMAYYACQHLG